MILRRCFQLGSYLPLQLVDRIKAITGATVLNAYGSNEIGIVAWQSDHTGDATDVGLIVSGIEVKS